MVSVLRGDPIERTVPPNHASGPGANDTAAAAIMYKEEGK
jgi:hypothetical protein